MSTDQPDRSTVVLVRTALRELCQWCETVLTEWHDPALQAGLLDRSGHVFDLAEDFRLAARYWTRAAGINRERLDRAAEPTELSAARADLVSVLESLSRHHHHIQRPHKAIQFELELVDLLQAAGDAPGTARALARVGASMLAAARYTEAEEYLTRADQAFLPFDTNHPMAREHARVLNQLAEVHRHLRRPAEVRSCQRRAIEVAAVPLTPAAAELHELNTLVTTMVGQLSTFAEQVAALTTQVPKDQPSPDQLDKITDRVRTWLDVARSVDSMAAHLLDHVDTIVDAAGHRTTTQPKVLDALHDLAEWLVQTAKNRHAPDAMIGILDRSAQVYRLASAYPRAEEQWVRALRISDELVKRASDDATQQSARARSITILESRDELYHSWGRLSKAMDVELELADEYRAAGDQLGYARARPTRRHPCQREPLRQRRDLPDARRRRVSSPRTAPRSRRRRRLRQHPGTPRHRALPPRPPHQGRPLPDPRRGAALTAARHRTRPTLTNTLQTPRPRRDRPLPLPAMQPASASHMPQPAGLHKRQPP